MRVVYSYVAFSTPEQAEGDSRRRQDTGVQSWIAQHPGFVLDKSLTFRDEGRSRFHGRHLKKKGAMAKFLTLIEAGIVKPGSVLVIENLDRLSRMKINESMELAKKILVAGVDIVTLIPEDWYTKEGLESDPMMWMKLVWYFQRAHDESRMKSKRTATNWAQKREAIKQRKAVTATRPFWIDMVQDGIVVLPGRGKVDLTRPVSWQTNEKAEIVRLVFQMADEGSGSSRISQAIVARGWKINRAKIPTNTTIIRLLTDRQVLGEFQSRFARDAKGHRAAAGDVIENYYPAVIEPDQFARVQQGIERRLRRGRGRKGRLVTNLFSGLLFDARDDNKIYVRGCRGEHYLTNFAAMRKEKGAVWIDYPYKIFEKAMIKTCRELPTDFLSRRSPAGETVKRLEAELMALKDKHQRAQKRLDNATDEAEEEVASQQLARLVRRRKELEADLEKARAELSTQPEDQLRQLQTLMAALNQTEDEEELVRVRTLVAGLLQTLVERIDIYLQRKGKRTRCQRRAWVWVAFTDGRRRKVFIDPQGSTVTQAYDAGEGMTDQEISVLAGDGWE